MKERFFKYFALLMLSVSVQISAASSSTRVAGHVPSKAISNAVFLKHLEPSTNVPITFTLPLRDQEELEDLVRRIHDPNDKEYYGKYLTSDEFVERFAPTQEDYDTLVAYAESLGFTINSTHPNRTLLNVTAPTTTIENAFNLNLHQYQTPEGRKFYAPDNDPEISAFIVSIIRGVVGLDNHSVRRALHRKNHTTDLSDTLHIASPSVSPSGPGRGYAPSDLVTAYNLTGVPANGSGQIVALFELGSYLESDINEYASYFGLPAPQLQNILVDGGSTSGIDPEVTLDIELVLALAPESKIYVYEGPNSDQGVLDTYNRIATDNLAKQVSTSWGMGEDLMTAQQLQAEQAIFLQMAAHGQTIYAAAGDSGAYDDYPDNSSLTLVVDDPASQPYVVGVGGTRLTVNGETGAYQSESVWNNGLGNGAGGGGVSTVWPIPSWQANVTTVYSKSHRNVPDVALNADPTTGYAIYYNGQWTIYGGTSCAAPLWAAFTALVNQELLAQQKPVLGFANPALYAIGTGSSYATTFHDVTSGNNLYYSAHNGYDNASGWGSFNGTNLLASLTNSSPTPPAPTPPAPTPPAPTPPAPTPPTPPPPATSALLQISMTHYAPFIKGRVGTYQITVSNHGSGPTSGPVTVAITIPNGLTYQSFLGAGWTFNKTTQTFTQNAVLAPGASYPPLRFNVLVRSNAPYQVVPTATVAGGGSVSSTITNLTTITKR